MAAAQIGDSVDEDRHVALDVVGKENAGRRLD